MFRTALINESLRRTARWPRGSPPRCWSCSRWSAVVLTPATTIRRAASAGVAESQRPGLGLRHRCRRMGRAAAQPPDHQRRSHCHRRQRARRVAGRLDHGAAGRRQRTRSAPPRRRAHRTVHCCDGSAAAARALARRVARDRGAHRRGPLHAAAHRPLPHRPPRRIQPWRRPGAASCTSRATTARSTWAPAAAPSSGAKRNATHYTWSEPQHDDFADWVARARPRRRAQRRRHALRVARDDRRRRPRPLRPLGKPPRIRPGVGAAPPWRAGWAPYRYGHWTWVSPWGWTWVDDAPWGFAPFHYGRWVVVARPLVLGARALRRAAGLCAGAGGLGRRRRSVSSRRRARLVGWVPLAPREPYYPHYARAGGYWKSVNSAHLHLFPTCHAAHHSAHGRSATPTKAFRAA